MPDFILADGGGIGVIVFLVISFISWILNMKNEGQKPKNRPRPNQPNRPAQAAKRPDALKNELEMFLEEVTGAKPRAEQNNPRQVDAARPPRPQRRERPAGGRPDAPRSKPAVVQQQKPKRRRVQQQKAQAPPKADKPKAAKQPKRELGSKLREHVDDYMGEHRVDKHVAEHLAEGVSGRKSKRIGSSVKEHLGATSFDGPVQIEVDPPPATTASLIKMLRNPTSVRNAILVNEILQPPRALRK